MAAADLIFCREQVKIIPAGEKIKTFKFSKHIDKQKAECYLKNIDVSTPLKRVLTGYTKEKEHLSGYRNWMKEKEKY